MEMNNKVIAAILLLTVFSVAPMMANAETATVEDSKTPTENFNLHTLLFEGPFGQYSLMCPYMYDSNGLLTINGSLATGTMDLEFTDNLNNVDFNSLRETMGLTVQ